MVGRLACLGLLLATLPLAVDLPASRDSSSRSALEVEAAVGGGQFAVVSRGCNGQVLREVHDQVSSGALVVQERLPGDFVIGVRGGNVRTTFHPITPVLASPYSHEYRDSTHTRRATNPYVNPFMGYEGRYAGVGVGMMFADQPFLFPGNDMQKVNTTAHVRFGDERGALTFRWMEDVPLESEGHLSVDLGAHPSGRFEAGAFMGFLGPYDGAMLGMRGRLWVTPEAAVQLKASVAGNHEYGVYGSVQARLPGPR